MSSLVSAFVVICLDKLMRLGLQDLIVVKNLASNLQFRIFCTTAKNDRLFHYLRHILNAKKPAPGKDIKIYEKNGNVKV